MTERLLRIATLSATVGSGLMAALLLTFSLFVMRALGRMPAHQGIAKMQSMNAAILNPIFGLVFVGTTISCLFLAVTASSTGNRPGAALRLIGAILFLVGTILVTMAVNVPLNNALAKLNPASATAASFWQHYQARWTAWNHLRALTAAGATVILALASRRPI